MGIRVKGVLNIIYEIIVYGGMVAVGVFLLAGCGHSVVTHSKGMGIDLAWDGGNYIPSVRLGQWDVTNAVVKENVDLEATTITDVAAKGNLAKAETTEGEEEATPSKGVAATANAGIAIKMHTGPQTNGYVKEVLTAQGITKQNVELAKAIYGVQSSLEQPKEVNEVKAPEVILENKPARVDLNINVKPIPQQIIVPAPPKEEPKDEYIDLPKEESKTETVKQTPVNRIADLPTADSGVSSDVDPVAYATTSTTTKTETTDKDGKKEVKITTTRASIPVNSYSKEAVEVAANSVVSAVKSDAWYYIAGAVAIVLGGLGSSLGYYLAKRKKKENTSTSLDQSPPYGYPGYPDLDYPAMGENSTDGTEVEEEANEAPQEQEEPKQETAEEPKQEEVQEEPKPAEEVKEEPKSEETKQETTEEPKEDPKSSEKTILS